MKITKETKLIDIINNVAAHPGILDMNIGGLYQVARENDRQRMDGLSSESTLMEFYREYYLPNISVANDVNQLTIYQREVALGYWVRLVGDTPLEEIDVAATTAYVVGLKGVESKGRALTKATIKKHCMAIAAILNIAGPRSQQHKNALGLIPVPPPFPSMRVRINVTSKTPTIEEYAKILDNCEVARWPRIDGISPQQWWRSVYMMLYNTGIRRSELFLARWCDIRDMNGFQALVIPVENEKMEMEKVIPLNSHALEAISKMPRNAENDNIFPLVSENKTLQMWRSRIAEAAGIPRERATFHAMRRMLATYVENPEKVLGHTNPATTRNHYMSVLATKRFLENLPQPKRNIEDEKPAVSVKRTALHQQKKSRSAQ